MQPRYDEDTHRDSARPVECGAKDARRRWAERAAGLAAAWISVGLFALLASGCSRSVVVTVEADVPEAAVDRLPLAAGVVYDQEFRSHVYREDTAGRPDWAIDTGASQVRVFDQVFRSMFTSVTEVGADAAYDGFDLTFRPHIQDMQFSMPDETGFDFFEAWISYRIDIVDRTGELITEWEVTAYGKSVSGTLSSRTESIDEAVQLALRDAGAKISTGFTNHPDIEQWLKTRTR
jgi:hypothetical protein